MKSHRRFILSGIAVLIIVALLMGCTKALTGDEVNQKLELAVKYISENKYEEAILAYKEVIKIDPKIEQVYKGLSVAYTLQGDVEQAQAALKQGLKQRKDNVSLQMALAVLYNEMSNVEKATDIYKDIIEKDNAYLPAYKGYSRLLISQGKHAEAIALLEQTLQHNDNYHLHNLLAEVYISCGDTGKAMEALKQSLVLEANQADAYNLLVQLYQDQPEQLLAEADELGDVVKILALYNVEEYQEVLTVYQQLSTEDQANVKAYTLAALASLETGDKEKAKSLLAGIKIAEFQDAALLAELAECYLQLGELDMAVKLAKQAIKHDDTLVDAYVILYRADYERDQSQANIWLAQYLVNSDMGLEHSVNKLSEELEQHQLPSEFLKDKEGLTPLGQLETSVLTYLQQNYLDYLLANGSILETYKMDDIYLVKYGDKWNPNGSIVKHAKPVYLVYNAKNQQVNALLDKAGDLCNSNWEYSWLQNIDGSVIKDINNDGALEWVVVGQSSGSGGFANCYVYNYKGGKANLIFSSDNIDEKFKDVTQKDGKYMLHYLLGDDNWEGSNADRPHYNVWYYWNSSGYTRVTDKPEVKITPAININDFTVGEIKLYMPREQVIQIIGQPQSVVEKLGMDPYIQLDYPGLSIDTFDAMEYTAVCVINITSPNYPTARGLKVGDPESKVIELYGNPLHRTENSMSYCDLTSKDIDTSNGDKHYPRGFNIELTNRIVTKIQLYDQGW